MDAFVIILTLCLGHVYGHYPYQNPGYYSQSPNPSSLPTYQLAPATAPYAPATAPYAPATTPYAPATAPYAPATTPYASATAPYAPARGPNAPATAPYAPATVPYAPAAAPYAPATAPYALATAPTSPAAVPAAPTALDTLRALEVFLGSNTPPVWPPQLNGGFPLSPLLPGLPVPIADQFLPGSGPPQAPTLELIYPGYPPEFGVGPISILPPTLGSPLLPQPSVSPLLPAASPFSAQAVWPPASPTLGSSTYLRNLGVPPPPYPETDVPSQLGA